MAIGLFSMRISKVSSFVALNLAVAVKPGLPVVQFPFVTSHSIAETAAPGKGLFRVEDAQRKAFRLSRHDSRFSTGQALLHPLHESGIEAPRFVVRVTGKSWEACPLVRSLTQNAILASGS